MKYKKPYYDDKKSFRSMPPAPMVQLGIGLFLRIFEKEIRDDISWKKQPSLSQLIMQRGVWLFWHTKEVPEVRKRALPFIAVIEEAYAKDPNKTIQIYAEIMYSYSEIQHSAYMRDIEYKKEDDYVKRFNLLFDEYRFRYEELFNRLISITYGCMGVIIGEPPVDGIECINIDANKKLKRINSSLLPTNIGYENISTAINGINPGVRNALSHGGRTIQLPDEEKFLLQDSSGWKQKYSLEEFYNELDILNRVITSFEFGALVINMNYVKKMSETEKNFSHELTQEQKNQILFSSAQDCQFEVLEGESNPPFLDIKLRFTPIQPRESEFYGSWLGMNLTQKIPARSVELIGQVFRFIYFSSVILEEDTPGMRIEVYTWGDKLLARAEIKDVEGFNEATKEIKGDDDYKTKEYIEKKYVKWERFSWAVGEIGKDGTAIQD